MISSNEHQTKSICKIIHIYFGIILLSCFGPDPIQTHRTRIPRLQPNIPTLSPRRSPRILNFPIRIRHAYCQRRMVHTRPTILKNSTFVQSPITGIDGYGSGSELKVFGEGWAAGDSSIPGDFEGAGTGFGNRGVVCA